MTLPDGLLLRGFVDRLDVAPNGALRVVDYKTGAVPREAFEGKALFQMKFYALVLWRTRGVVRRPAEAALPQGRRRADLRARRGASWSASSAPSQAIWAAIERAVATGDFRPEQDAALRLVRPPGALPGLRAALPRRSPPRPRRPPAGRPCPIVERD